MLDIPVGEPSDLILGDTIQWTREDLTADFPASQWTLTYEARSNVASGSIQITASQNGSAETFLISVPAATSANWKAGLYSWAAYVTKGPDRYRVDYGKWKAVRNLATTSSGYDDRSHAKKVVDAIEAVLEGRASEDAASLTAGGKTIQKLSPLELLKFRNHYRQEYARELNRERLRNGQPSDRFIKVQT